MTPSPPGPEATSLGQWVILWQYNRIPCPKSLLSCWGGRELTITVDRLPTKNGRDNIFVFEVVDCGEARSLGRYNDDCWCPIWHVARLGYWYMCQCVSQSILATHVNPDRIESFRERGKHLPGKTMFLHMNHQYEESHYGR